MDKDFVFKSDDIVEDIVIEPNRVILRGESDDISFCYAEFEIKVTPELNKELEEIRSERPTFGQIQQMLYSSLSKRETNSSHAIL